MISTRGRYAIRVMIDLVENNNGHYIPLKDKKFPKNTSKLLLKKWWQVSCLLELAGEVAVTSFVENPKNILLEKFLTSWKAHFHPLLAWLTNPLIVPEKLNAKHFPCGQNMTIWFMTSSTAKLSSTLSIINHNQVS